MVAEAGKAKKLDFAEIQIPAGPRLGSKVLVAKNLHKEFDGRVLIDDLSFELPRNGIVGVIGPNGVGKTTLFKTIVGLEPLDGGELEVGETVKIAYVDQNRAGIDPDKKLWEVVSGGTDYMMVGETEVPSRAYVAAFGFKGADQQKPAGVLSGGERNPAEPGAHPEGGQATCSFWTSPPTTWTWRPSPAWRRRCSTSPAARSWSATTACSSTASPPIFWLGKATTRIRAAGTSSRATSRPTRPTARHASARKPPSPTASTAN